MDAWNTIPKACPRCKADIKWWVFGDDCRGNPGSSGAYCAAKCGWSVEPIPAWIDTRTNSVKKEQVSG